MKGPPTDPTPGDPFPCGLPPHILWPESALHGCSYSSQHFPMGLPASPPSSRRICLIWSSRKMMSLLCSSYATGFYPTQGKAKSLQGPPAMQDHNWPSAMAALPTPKARTKASTSLLLQGAQLQEQDRHNPSLGPFPLPHNGVFLPQLPTWLPLTSDLLMS